MLSILKFIEDTKTIGLRVYLGEKQNKGMKLNSWPHFYYFAFLSFTLEFRDMLCFDSSTLLTYFINKISNFIRIGRAGTVLGHTQEGWCYVIASHFRPSIQASVQLAQVKVLGEKDKGMTKGNGHIHKALFVLCLNCQLYDTYQHMPNLI